MDPKPFIRRRAANRAGLVALRLLSVLLGALAVLIAVRAPPHAPPTTAPAAAQTPGKVAQGAPR
ncbi:MAG: hypothetical protein HZC37_00035 [Burkholderiales bacterium]|nr:hypothetical protein [Burkholderiales bacterium]